MYIDILKIVGLTITNRTLLLARNTNYFVEGKAISHI